MAASKHYTWKTGIALMMLGVWIGIDGLAAIAGGQVQPPRLTQPKNTARFNSSIILGSVDIST